MSDNTITVNGIDYDILFVFRDPEDQLLLLVTDGTDTYCVRYEQDGENVRLLPASEEQIEQTVQAYNEHVQDIIEYEGILYERTADVSGITLAVKEGDPAVLYAFQPEPDGWKPVHLDEAGKLFYKNMYRARLEENHNFLQEAQPLTAPASRASEHNRLCSLDDFGVYLIHESDAAPSLLFVNEKTGKSVISPAEQRQLTDAFRAWEQEEYERSRNFVLENVETS